MGRTFKRLSNGLVRTLRGLKRGELTPDIPNDLFQAHFALYHFAGGLRPRRTLDYGCRTGFGSVFMQRCGASSVLGVDPDERNLRHAELYARQVAAETVEFGTEVPRETRFDLITVLNQPDPGRIAASLAASLSPGGRLVFNVPPNIDASGAPAPVAQATESWLSRFADSSPIAYYQLAPGDARVDLSSPESSSLEASEFTFLPAIDEPPDGIISTVVVITASDMPAERLHIGSGPVQLPGWINVDNQYYPNVDVVLDVTEGLPFRDVRLLYAEHFIEHLNLQQGVAFLRACRQIMREDGVLRISTPNLKWVLATQYSPLVSERDPINQCIDLNRGFHGWGHQFLYDEATLEHVLRVAGFRTVTPCAYGSSSHSELQAIERHETYPDSYDLSHVIVLEATGIADPAALNSGYDEYVVAIGTS